MHLPTLLAFIFLCSMTFSNQAQANTTSLPSSFKLKGLERGQLSAKDLEGEMLVIQFWASWCQGCGSVMGDLNKLLKNEKSAKFLPVSVDETVTEARSYFGHQDRAIKPLRKIAYLDVNAKLATELDITALPAMVVVNRDGQIVRRIIGHPTKKQMHEIKALINK